MNRSAFVCVMCKHKDEDEFGMEKAFSIKTLGAIEAFYKAKRYMEEAQKASTNIDYDLDVKEW